MLFRSADLGIEQLAGSQRLVAFDEVNDVIGHLIVSAPRHIAEVVADDNRRNVAVLLENGGSPQLKGGASGNARNILDGVIIKKVHNDVVFATKLWTL